MDAINIGPLALPAGVAIPLLGLFAALTTNALWQRRGQSTEKAIWCTAFTALIGARTAFVLRYPDQYSTLQGIVDIRDGGWWWPGALAALPVLLFFLWRQRHRRPALLSNLAASLVAMTLTLATLQAFSQPAEALPDITLYDLKGSPKPLQQEGGHPMVVNLWATWCPPCRREMPVMEAAQSRYPTVKFLMANQAENATAVRHYLTNAQLAFNSLRLDPHSDLSRFAGNPGLPLTLIFDSDGNQVARHFGPLSSASLHHLLSEHFPEIAL